MNASTKESDKTMKKISAVLLGLSLTLATAGMSFAAQAAATPTDSSAPTVKKHVKKHKKANKDVTATPATPAPAPSK
jgi:uncharacterized protein YxeA